MNWPMRTALASTNSTTQYCPSPTTGAQVPSSLNPDMNTLSLKIASTRVETIELSLRQPGDRKAELRQRSSVHRARGKCSANICSNGRISIKNFSFQLEICRQCLPCACSLSAKAFYREFLPLCRVSSCFL